MRTAIGGSLPARHLITSLLETDYSREGRLQILDIGCGTGAMLDELAPFGTVVGADFSPEALQFCVTRGVGVDLTRADVRRLPFADASFDVVTAMDIIEHIDDDKAASCEIFRVLKPGGRLYVTVPAFPSLWSEHDEALHHYRRYTVPRLKDLFQRVGLSINKVSYTVTTLFPPIWVYRQISNLLPKRHAEGEKKANLVNFAGPVNAVLLSLSNWGNKSAPSAQSAVRRHSCLYRAEADRNWRKYPKGLAMSRLPLRNWGYLAGAASLGLLGYAAGIEPYAIETVHLELFASRLPEAFEGYTILQVSDLHMRQMGRRERLLDRLIRALPP